MFALGYALQRTTVIATASHGREENILLLTLGVSIVIDNLAFVLLGALIRAPSTRAMPLIPSISGLR